MVNWIEMKKIGMDWYGKVLGTLSLLSGINLLTGQAIPSVGGTQKRSDFIILLKVSSSFTMEKQ